MGQKPPGTRKRIRVPEKQSFALTSGILQAASEGLPKTEFYYRVLKLLIGYVDCDVVFIKICGGTSNSCAVALSRTERSFHFTVKDQGKRRGGGTAPDGRGEGDLFHLLRSSEAEGKDRVKGAFSENGSFWVNDVTGYSLHTEERIKRALIDNAWPAPACGSIALVPLSVGEAGSGYLQFGFKRPEAFSPAEIEILEYTARAVSTALIHWHATWSLRERVKELSCLYKIANILESPTKPPAEALAEIVRIIPPAWLHADVAAARITFDKQTCATEGYKEGAQSQAAPIVVNGQQRGLVEVVYTETMPELDEGPFLYEERRLLDTIALELSVRIERGLYEKQQRKIKEQMKHSNRLAMVGQFASAVAHEINEPLTNILGFAQLAIKCPDLPGQAASDLDKIVATSLYVREIVRKLLMYGRKMPQRESLVNVNKIAEESISFFEHRFAKEGITPTLFFAENAGQIIADPGQLRQVFANLLVNAIQAMPTGGALSIETRRSGEQISLIVRDTGCGMTPDIKDKIFIPFFTTKSVRQGTGLGLSVVLEIVTGLKGTIFVDSSPGVGTCVEVRLPEASSSPVAERRKAHAHERNGKNPRCR